jgi:hypothetical protein
LKENKYPTRYEWARPWTSQYRHYNTITSSPLEGMHKVLKDYLATSRGDLLRVVHRIKEMVYNQYNKYRKEIATAQHSIKFEHKNDVMPFLPSEIHRIVTPPAIEHVRQQELLRQKHNEEYRIEPCTGSFRKVYGLPCSHTLQQLREIGSRLHLNHFDDDHWRYRRREGQSINMPPRPYQHVLEPLTVSGRGRPRKDEASTRRDLSAFERSAPPTFYKSPPRTLAEILQETITTTPFTSQPTSMPISVSVPISVSLPASLFTPVSVSVPVSIPISIPLSPIAASPPSTDSSPKSSVSINVSVPVLITMTSSQQSAQQPAQQPAQQSVPQPAQQSRTYPPTLDDFLADIECRKSQSLLQEYRNPNSLASYLAETGQEDDPSELVSAREMALATTGLFASCTPIMAWNYTFGDREAFYTERFKQVRTQNLSYYSQDSSQRPKRVAAQNASAAWSELSPRKRQRRQ